MTDHDPLSERELEILRLVATGASNKEIARQLSISANTVKVHLRNIFGKIGASSRTEAAYLARREQWFSAEGPGPSEHSSTASTRSQATRVAGVAVNRWLIGVLGILLAAVIAGATWLLSPPPHEGNHARQEVAPSRWKMMAALPEGRTGVAAVALEDRIVIIGGETVTGVSAEVYSMDPLTDGWVRLQDKPTAVADAEAAVVGGLIYVPGGRLAHGGTTDVLEVFDPSAESWRRAAPVPRPVSGYGLTAFEGRLYLIGGWDGRKALASCYSYDPDSDRWTELPPLPSRRAFAGVAVASGVLYAVGGRDGDQLLDSSVELPLGVSATTRHIEWQAGPSLAEPRSGGALLSVADLLYLFGGSGSTSRAGVLELVPGQDRWSPADDLPTRDWSDFGAARLGPQIVLVGGVEDGHPSTMVASFQAIYTVLIPAVP
jgi:DNA-binding CsgD family transcriptional regulator/N-acetylneuraminic acid mutarotase